MEEPENSDLDLSKREPKVWVLFVLVTASVLYSDALAM